MSAKMLADATAVYQEFERYRKLERLEQAVAQFRTALEVIPEDDTNYPSALYKLGACLQHLFGQLGRLEDLDESIERHQAAADRTSDGHSDRALYLQGLGNAFGTRFNRAGNSEDLNKAITQQQAAVDLTPDNHPQKPVYLNNLGCSFHSRFELLGDLVDLDNAIVTKQKAVDLSPNRYPDKSVRLINLGNSLHLRFIRFGNVVDLDNAIAHQQAAVNFVPDGHLNKFGYLSNLGSSLQARFDRLGNVIDLNNAIVQHQQAVNLISDSHPHKANCLTGLGNSLNARFQHLSKIADINDTIATYQSAVNLTLPGHPYRASRLSNLGGALYARFERTGQLIDIEESIAKQQLAVDITPDGHPSKPNYLSTLGSSILARFERSTNWDDLERAITQHRKAVDLTPNSHPSKPRYLMKLGKALETSFLHHRHHWDADAVISNLSAAAKSPAGPPKIRFEAAETWISFTSFISDPTLLEAYGCALSLMPLVAWLGLPIADRYQHLIRIGGIAREAAAAAIFLDEYDKALEWLEQGRSIVWNQILQLRTPVDELRDNNPDLADRLLRVSIELGRGYQQSGPSQGKPLSIEEEGRRYRALTMEWESTIEQVRGTRGFEEFLRPLSSSQLKNAARSGPVVILNIAKTKCEALALLPGSEDVIHIPLPNISAERVTQLRDELKDQLFSSGIRMRDTRAAKRVIDEADEASCKRVLAELWSNLVKPVLDSLGLSVGFVYLDAFILLMTLSTASPA
jgi:tetratricopeptide (TPR) repeat protein